MKNPIRSGLNLTKAEMTFYDKIYSTFPNDTSNSGVYINWY